MNKSKKDIRNKRTGRNEKIEIENIFKKIYRRRRDFFQRIQRFFYPS